MKSEYYVALLRGINVGGKNIVPMTKLKACFENLGFSDVLTYIQSGNVIFRSNNKGIKNLRDHIEKGLSREFKLSIPTLVISEKKLETVIKGAPKDFGVYHNDYRYDVIFLFDGISSKAVLKQIKVRDGVDAVWAGKDVLYFSRLAQAASKSYLSKVVGLPVYKDMTIRNWNTTTRLFEITREKHSE